MLDCKEIELARCVRLYWLSAILDCTTLEIEVLQMSLIFDILKHTELCTEQRVCCFGDYRIELLLREKIFYRFLKIVITRMVLLFVN